MQSTRLLMIAARAAFALAVLAVLATRASTAQSASPKQFAYYAQPAIKDFSGRIRVVSKNLSELKKLGDGFVRAYNVKSQRFYYKEPGKVRLEARQGLITARLITNGDVHVSEYRFAPGITKRSKDDLREKPGKGDYSINFGVITPSFAKRVVAEFVRFETRDARRVAVFTVYYTATDKVKHTVVIDRETRIVVDHISHHRSKKRTGFKNRYVFSQPKQFGSIWLPTRIEVYSPDNKLAGRSVVEDVKANSGLSDSLFKIR